MGDFFDWIFCSKRAAGYVSQPSNCSIPQGSFLPDVSNNTMEGARIYQPPLAGPVTVPFPSNSTLNSPRLDRDLIARLYHQARTERVPMTALPSRRVREGLANEFRTTGCVVAEEPPAHDPGQRKT